LSSFSVSAMCWLARWLAAASVLESGDGMAAGARRTKVGATVGVAVFSIKDSLVGWGRVRWSES
jgi:hypothetical protein